MPWFVWIAIGVVIGAIIVGGRPAATVLWDGAKEFFGEILIWGLPIAAVVWFCHWITWQRLAAVFGG